MPLNSYPLQTTDLLQSSGSESIYFTNELYNGISSIDLEILLQKASL